MVEKLISVFYTRFENFRIHNAYFQLFAHPFDLVVEDNLFRFQLKITKLQANVNLIRTCNKNNLLAFYKSYVYGN